MTHLFFFAVFDALLNPPEDLLMFGVRFLMTFGASA